MSKKKQKTILFAVIAIVLISIAAYASYNRWMAPTRIGLLNFPPYMATSIKLSNEDSSIKYTDVSVEDIDHFSRYDFILGFGMGLKMTAEQREKLQHAVDKHLPVLIYMATSPENNISSLDSIQRQQVIDYLSNGNKKNYRSLGRYVRTAIDKHKLFTTAPDSVQESASDVLYHLDEERSFATVSEYEKYLRDEVGHFDPNAPKVAMVGGFNDAFSGNRENIDSIIVAFERAGFTFYPMSAGAKRLELLQAISPDAVIYFPHGRMMMGKADAAVDWLRQRNIPLFTPLTIMQTQEKWEEDKMGMFGGFLSQSVVTPEIDGGIYPYVLNVQRIDKDGYYRFTTIERRLKDFTQIVSNFISLQKKANAEKRLAIVYFKGPGQSTLAAQGLETAPSLYNLLLNLKAKGYKVDNLPEDAKSFEQLIMTQGGVFSTYAEGVFDEFLRTGKPQLIEKKEYEEWAAQSMPENSYRDVVEQYGEAPGKYMAVNKNGKEYIAVAAIRFGNVTIMPQPMSGLGGDGFAIVHGAKSPPPHTYIAPYLWIQHGFKADAMLHFGTHGSLEFTPQKQVALSNNDWGNILVGTVPHFYYYTIGNIGESVMAKRRSYATTISYLTPAFSETKTRTQYRRFTDAVNDYYKADNSLKEKASLRVKKVAVEMGLHRDLRMDSTLTTPYSEEDIERLENFAEEIANEKMSASYYITGIPFPKEKIHSTVMAMSADPIAYSIAALDRLDGRVSEKQLRKGTFFTKQYLNPAKAIVEKVFNGATVDSSFVANVAGISVKEIAEAHRILNPKPKGMMAMMMASASGGRPQGMGQGGKGGHPGAMAKGEAKAQGGHPGHPGHPGAMAKGEAKAQGGHSGHPGHPGAMAKGDAKAQGGHSGHPGHPGAMAKGEAKAQGGHPGHPGHPGAMTKGEAKASNSKHQGKADKAVAATAPQDHSKKDKPVAYTPEQKARARAIAEIERTITHIQDYKTALQTSPSAEIASIVNALAGGYVAPSSGGDAVANPSAVPTGRNLYSINAEATPSEGAWDKGVALADATITQYRRNHDGAYPRKVSYTFWSSEFIETEGATIAQVLYMLGVKPIRDTFGRVSDLELIPIAELGRPRIDIVVQTSGQFRDIAASRLALITRAVEMAAHANDGDSINFVKNGTIDMEKELVEKGISPKTARELSVRRVFGGINGMYGTGIQEMITSGDKWENESEIAEVYLNNMGASYADDKTWGEFEKGLLRAALHNTDAIIHPRQSNMWGALSLDHVYEFMGGMNLTIRNVTGKDPDAFFADYRNRNHVRIQDLKEAIGVEARSTIFNPEFVKELVAGGSSSAARIEEVVTNTYGWNVAKPSVIDKEMWDKIYSVYVKDEFSVGTQQFFERENPAALQEITAVMLETVRKGMWKASDEQQKEMAALHTRLVEKYGAAGKGFSGGNKKLQQFIATKVDAATAKQYTEQVKKSEQTVEQPTDGKVLKKQELTPTIERATEGFNGFIVLGVVLVLFVVILLFIRRKRKNND